MNTAALIEQANMEGIVLALNGDRLAWSASRQPPPDLLAQLRESKGQIAEHLRQQQRAWLDRVAVLLNTSASTLLERGLIDLDDLAEQYRMHPRFAARLIESNPPWQQVNLVQRDGEFRDQYAPARETAEVRTQCVPPEVNTVNTPTRESGANTTGTRYHHAPEWLAARDAFHSHAVGNCNDCYPPAGRYCPTGAHLLALYKQAQQ